MKVVVAGAAGTQSRGALWYLLKQKDISQIVAADIRLDKVKELVAELRDERLVAKFVDLSDVNGTAEVFKGTNVVVDCAYEGYGVDEADEPNLGLRVTKAALEAGVNYTSVGGAPSAPEQLALSDEFKRKGILAILGIGLVPGLSQILAAYAINKLDRTDSVYILSGRRDLVPPEEHSRPLPWTSEKRDMAGLARWRTLVDSVSYEDGKLHYHPPMANPEVVRFREPIGAVTVTLSPGAPLLSIHRSFPDIKNISFKTGGARSRAGEGTVFLSDLGFFSKKPINVQGQMVSPWEVLMTLVVQLHPETKPADVRAETRVIVRGEEAGKQVEYTLSSLQKEREPARVGVCGAIAAVMLMRGQTKGTGVLMPEQCIPPEQYLDELHKTGTEDIEISRKVRL